MSSNLIEAMRVHVPVPVYAAILCLGAVIIRHVLRRSHISRIPSVGSKLGNVEKQRKFYLHGAKNLYQEGYQKFKGRICRIVTVRDADIVLVSPDFLPELRKLPDDVLSMSAAVLESMEAKYTKLNPDQPVITHTIKASLTPALTWLNPVLAEVVDRAIQDEMPLCEAWTPINMYSKLLRIVAIASGHVFIGPELCRKEAYLDASINYTIDLMNARQAVQSITPWLRRWKAPGLPEIKKLHQRIEEADVFLRPIVTERREAEKISGYEKPNDMLQWLMDSEGMKDKDDEHLARHQLSLSFAAIHTTCLTMTNAFYNLAAYPDIVNELRDEVKTALAENDGVFTSMVLQKMKKLDSFLKETLRMHPPSYASFERKVLKPIVLSNGQKIPVGATIEVPAYGINRDDAVFPDADKFDGLRFYKLREKSQSFNEVSGSGARSDSAAHNQFVSVSQNSLTFGYGRHACPGRFFAANEIKMILSRMILEFDIRNTDEITERYPNIEVSNTSIPDPRRSLLFKRIN